MPRPLIGQHLWYGVVVLIPMIEGVEMQNQVVSFLDFILALSPIAAVLVLMVGFRWGGAKAGAVGWLVALAVSLLYFGADTTLLAYAQPRGVLLTLFVLYIIWMALILFTSHRKNPKVFLKQTGFRRIRVKTGLYISGRILQVNHS